ncbi:MAG: thiosulfate oxidation carrier protein SoxY [Siculibacillus sp.]
MSEYTRRQTLTFGAAAFLSGGLLTAAPAFAANDTADVVKAFLAGREPVKGKITLDLPEIAENGNTVPLGVLVDSPMTAQSHVSEIVVLAEGNPNSAVVRFGLTPASGKAEISVRIRLAATQNVVVLARTSDGAVYMEKKSVKVTVAGCGG